MTVDDLVGTIVLCPHCTQPLKIIRVTVPIQHHNGSTGYGVQLEDGEWARFWLTGPNAA